MKSKKWLSNVKLKFGVKSTTYNEHWKEIIDFNEAIVNGTRSLTPLTLIKLVIGMATSSTTLGSTHTPLMKLFLIELAEQQNIDWNSYCV